MKTLKLTPVQLYRTKDAYQALSEVLNAVKRDKLEGAALEGMRTLEKSVQYLEGFLMGLPS